jgi:hypothetical protein
MRSRLLGNQRLSHRGPRDGSTGSRKYGTDKIALLIFSSKAAKALSITPSKRVTFAG